MAKSNLKEEEKEIKELKAALEEREKALKRKKQQLTFVEEQRAEAKRKKQWKKEFPYEWKFKEYQKLAISNNERWSAFSPLSHGNPEGPIVKLFCLIDELFERNNKEIRKLKKEIAELKKEK